MTCESALELAALASRGELDNRKQERLRNHLAGCEACRRAENEAEALDGALRSTLGRPAIAIDLRPAVMRRLPEPRRARPWLATPRWLPAGAGFAAAAIVFAGWFGFHRLPGRPPSVKPPPGPVRPTFAPEIGKIAAAPGTLAVQGAGGNRPGEEGSALRAGDTLRTAAKAGARLELRDGTKLELAPETSLRLEAAGLSLVSGRVLARVAPQHQDFVVRTRQAEARVLGTVFSVEARHGDTTLVTVARGAVRVANDAGETFVPAGTFTAARAGLPPLPAEEIDTAALLGATDGDTDSHALTEADLGDEIDAARRAILLRQMEVQALREELDRIAAAKRSALSARRAPASTVTSGHPR